MGRIWDDILSERDRQFIKKSGYGDEGAASWQSRGLGIRPVVLVIDVQQMTVGRNVSILEVIEEYRTAMGEVAWAAMEHIAPLLSEARKAKIPVIYTRLVPRGRSPQEPAVQVAEPVAPREGDLVIDKMYSSAFYGTGLITYLVELKADTVIIAGTTTNGCVRATAIDARQHGFSVVIPEECVFDRIEVSHKATLLDLWMKYAEVISDKEALAYIRKIGKGPQG